MSGPGTVPHQSERKQSDGAVTAAMLVAAAMIANHVGGLATRDALFFSNFDITALPVMLIGASLFSIATVVFFSRAMPRLSPQRLVPWGFGTSAVFLLAEWGLISLSPRVAAVALYLHLAVVGAFLISRILVGDQRAVRPSNRQEANQSHCRCRNSGRSGRGDRGRKGGSSAECIHDAPASGPDAPFLCLEAGCPEASFILCSSSRPSPGFRLESFRISNCGAGALFAQAGCAGASGHIECGLDRLRFQSPGSGPFSAR